MKHLPHSEEIGDDDCFGEQLAWEDSRRIQVSYIRRQCGLAVGLTVTGRTDAAARRARSKFARIVETEGS